VVSTLSLFETTRQHIFAVVEFEIFVVVVNVQRELRIEVAVFDCIGLSETREIDCDQRLSGFE